MVLLPTPPLPLTMAIIFFTPANICPPSFLLLDVFDVKFTVTIASLFTNNLTAFSLALRIISFIGQAGVVKIMVKATLLPSIVISLIMFNVTKSLPKSGSCTLLKACSIAASVITQVFVKKVNRR